MSNSLKPDPETEKWALPRRDFLVLGSAAVFGAAASSVTAATLRVVAMPSAGSILSIGYSDLTGPVPADAETATESLLSSAAGLRLSDGGFRRTGARIRVHGLSRPTDTPMSVRLTTFAPTAAGPVPFFAWAHTTDRHGRAQTSARASFVAALDENGTLPFAIERSEPLGRLGRLFAEPAPAATTSSTDLAALERSGAVCRLSSGSAEGIALRAGTYFIALRRSSYDVQPAWSSITVDRTAADASEALRHYGGPVDFEYIAVTVDYPVA